MKKNKYFDIVAIISIILLCFAFTAQRIPNDTFYTLKIGELILEKGIDMKDHFSWINNLPYTYPHWLYDVITALIYRINGFASIWFFNATCFSIIGILTYFLSKKRSNNYFFSFLLTIMIIAFGATFISPRAQIISFIFFILEKEFIDKFLETGNKKYSILIILLSILLVNIHLATWIFFFVLFLPSIAEHFITYILKKIKKINENFTIGRLNFKTHKNIYKLLLIILICMLTGFLTPLGTTPYTYIFNQFGGDTLDVIVEYADITISNCFSFYQFIAVIVFIFLLSKEKIELDDLFLLCGLIFMSLIAMRSFAFLLFIGAFAVSNYLGKITKNMKRDTIKKLDFIFTRKYELITILICFVTASIIFYIGGKMEYVSKKEYPINAVEEIKDNYNLEGIHIFNEYSIGAFLLYNDIPVFIDSRSDLYTKPFNKLKRDIFNDYIDVIHNLKYEEIFNYYGVTHVLFEKDSLLVTALYNDNNYIEVYSDNYFILFERKIK